MHAYSVCARACLNARRQVRGRAGGQDARSWHVGQKPGHPLYLEHRQAHAEHQLHGASRPRPIAACLRVCAPLLWACPVVCACALASAPHCCFALSACLLPLRVAGLQPTTRSSLSSLVCQAHRRSQTHTPQHWTSSTRPSRRRTLTVASNRCVCVCVCVCLCVCVSVCLCVIFMLQHTHMEGHLQLLHNYSTCSLTQPRIVAQPCLLASVVIGWVGDPPCANFVRMGCHPTWTTDHQ